MEVMWLILPLAVGIAAIAVVVFAWAVRTGQFDDLVTPSMRVLLDDDDATEARAGARQEKANGADEADEAGRDETTRTG